MNKLSSVLLLLVCSACAHQMTNAKFVNKIEASGYAKINEGQVQNFTAIRETIFDQEGREVSNTDNPKLAMQIANHGDVAYSTDPFHNKLLTFRLFDFPDYLHKDWDRYYILDTYDNLKMSIYIAFGKTTFITSNDKKNDGVEYIAIITDNGSIVHYKDADASIVFKKTELPLNTHTDWDKYYVDDELRYGLYKSTKRGIYLLSFKTVSGEEVGFYFKPMVYVLQSTQKGAYRAIYYVPLIADTAKEKKKFYVYDFLPTKKLICLDLARAYDTLIASKNKAITQAAIKGIIVALGGFSAYSYAGTSTSTYSGYYSGGNLMATGSTYHSGYAQGYNYSYLSTGAVNMLDAIFKGNASLDQIESALKYHECGLL